MPGSATAVARVLKKLSRDVGALSFSDPVTHVYDPLDYAWPVHRKYLDLQSESPENMLIGMNPGPFGMAQTGVPFGDPTAVRGWLGLRGKVGRPEEEHPKRRIVGLDSTRTEVSGTRVWGWAAEHYGRPSRFFKTFFIHNYCPLVFMEDSGRNRTPDKLHATERVALYEACDSALRKLVELLKPRRVIGIGAFAEKRAELALEGLDVEIGRVLHPSPASPVANRGWAKAATEQLIGLGINVPTPRSKK